MNAEARIREAITTLLERHTSPATQEQVEAFVEFARTGKMTENLKILLESDEGVKTVIDMIAKAQAKAIEHVAELEDA